MPPGILRVRGGTRAVTEAAWRAAAERGMRIWLPGAMKTIGRVFCPTCGWNGDVVCDLLKYEAEPFGCGRPDCKNYAGSGDGQTK